MQVVKKCALSGFILIVGSFLFSGCFSVPSVSKLESEWAKEAQSGITLEPQEPEVNLRRIDVSTPLQIYIAPEIRDELQLDYPNVDFKFKYLGYRTSVSESLGFAFRGNFEEINFVESETKSGIEFLLLRASVQQTGTIKFHTLLSYEGQELVDVSGETKDRRVQKQSTIYTWVKDTKILMKQLIEEGIVEMCESIYDAFMRDQKLAENRFWEYLAEPREKIVSAPAESMKQEATQKPGSQRRTALRRTALVIGNANYREAPLENPINDAMDVSRVLKKLGFTVTTLLNAQQQAIWTAIRGFGDELNRGGVGLFYFAGHGMQVNGVNYLIPVDAEIDSEEEIRFKTVDAGIVLAKMERAKNQANIVILDACRDNPFKRSFRSSSRGLAIMDAPRGSLVIFATAPGSVAGEGSARNGVFTGALLRYIETPGLEVEQMLKQVRKAVTEETRDSQVPWSSSSLTGNFYFAAAE